MAATRLPRSFFRIDENFVFRSLALVLIALTPHASVAEDRLRVMSFNIWHGGEAGGQPLSQTIKAITATQADIVGLQETHGKKVDGQRPDNGEKLARQLGWHYLQQGDRTGILSRFPIRHSTPKKWGVAIEYADGKSLHFFNAHFAASPYQPYQLLKIPYGDAKFIATESEAIQAANRARGESVGRLIAEMRDAIKRKAPVILTGDFNEPSHQDWTWRAAAAECCPLKIHFPTTHRIASAGLIDAWRTFHPDEVAFPGMTWTPTTKLDDPQDKHDRIDYIFVSGSRITVDRCEVVGEHRKSADIVVSPWPSDHRAVCAEVVITE